jgi:hypothetical protein
LTVNCTHCGALVHFDDGIGALIDDHNDQFCPDGERHEAPGR